MSDPYVDPATGVLRNRLGISDPDRLGRAEAKVAFHAEIRLYTSGVTVDRCDLAALQTVHRRLFASVYDWAGELRSVDIAKGASMFALARHLRPAATGVFRQVPETDLLCDVDPPRFVRAAGRLLADLNALDPFREGNGRAQRAFLQLLARDAGYQLRWHDVNPAENVAVSTAAMSDPTRSHHSWSGSSSRCPWTYRSNSSCCRGTNHRPSRVRSSRPSWATCRPGRDRDQSRCDSLRPGRLPARPGRSSGVPAGTGIARARTDVAGRGV